MEVEKEQPKPAIKLKGYLYVLIESFTIEPADKPVSCYLSLGSNAKCETRPQVSGADVNEVFLIEAPEEK